MFAKTLIVLGEVNGNISASDKVEIRDGGAVDGDIVSPRVAIAEGAHFRGSVDMQRKGEQSSTPPQARPVGQAAATSTTGGSGTRGPVVGSNVTFFGGEVGGKILTEGLSKDIDRHVSQSTVAKLPAFFEQCHLLHRC